MTGVEEDYTHTFASNWTGGTPSGTGDSEILTIQSSDVASESQDVYVGVRKVKIRYDYYLTGSGPTPVIKYKNTGTKAALSGAGWITYTGAEINCLGWMKLRFEYPP